MRAQRAGVGLAAAGTVALVAGWAGVMARQDAAAGIAIDGDDLAGVVTSVKGPEAGVWVIAETADLPTGFRKTVVTDDQGRYLVPDLPSASYAVWVRGYGLVDSPRVAARPGQRLNLTAVVAPDARAAAQYYPGNYWFSLLEIPGEDQFPGTGPDGNGIPENIRTQAQYVGTVKGGCSACHVTGPKATRELPEALGTFDSSLAAWERRTRSGQFGGGMGNSFRRLGPWAMRSFANWTDRIAGGAVPPQPPRPSGIERNFVFSSWDWASEFSFIHDIVATDKRNPTVNAYGPVWGADRHNAPDVSMVDPVKHTASRPVVVPIADKENTPFSTVQSVAEPSPYWGDQIIWSNRASTHNPMVDHKARLWLTATVRPRKNPSFCTDGALHPSAKLYPIEESERHLAMYDPKTGKVEPIGTCFQTHHLWFAHDTNHTLWNASIDQPYIGYLNTKVWEETRDEVKSQGWFPFVLDTNGNRQLDEFVGPGEAPDPAKDTRIRGGSYGIIPSPVDASVWTVPSGYPGMLIRVSPESGLSEVYEPPLPGHTTRGVDLDLNGVVWVTLNSGHFASFDRRKCKVLNGPAATGKHCEAGWTLYQTPGPNFAGVKAGSADFHYANFVDQYDTFGLGANTPIATGTNSDSLLALRPDGSWVVMRIPYPMNVNMRGMDGRIDDPKAGWKGRGGWVSYNSQAPWHYEGGKGQTSKAVHIQLRPDPLAK